MPDSMRPLAPYVAVITALILTYTARATAFTMGPDDFNFRAMSRADLYRFWMGQDRWGMAVTTYILGQPILPMVAVATGVGLIAFALWGYLRHCLEVSAWAAAAGTSVGATAPAIVFHTGSRTNALGLGIAFVLTAWATRLIIRGGWIQLAAAVFLGAYASSTYQTMAIVFGCMLLGIAVRTGRWSDLLRAAVIPALSLVGGFVFGRLLGMITASPSVGYVDPTNPPGGGPLSTTLRRAVTIYLREIAGSWTYWGIAQPWSGLLLLACALALLLHLLRATPRHPASTVAVVLLMLVPLADGFTGLPRRSLVHWAPIFAIVVALAVPRLTRLHRHAAPAAAMAVGLAVFGHAQLANAQYLAADTVFRSEQFIADRIKDQYLLLDPPPTNATIVVSPCPGSDPPNWPGREIFGFGSMTTDATQAAAALRYDGIPVRKPTIAEIRRANEHLRHMPQYPAPGWFRTDGSLLIAKCGPDPAATVAEAAS